MKTIADRVWLALFSIVAKKPVPIKPSADIFAWRQTQSEVWIKRFNDKLDFVGKTVLDFGCGMGATSILLAQRGAKFVVGVDNDPVRVEQAKQNLILFPELGGRVLFCTLNDLSEIKYDLVISQDAFEHYDEPVGVMRTIHNVLAKDGRVAIGFSPLWKSPYGGHIGCMTSLPWAHLIFPEHIIMKERIRYRPKEHATKYSEMVGGLGKMTHARFLNVINDSGFIIEQMATNVSNSRSVPVVNLIRRIPGCFEYFTKSIYAIVRVK